MKDEVILAAILLAATGLLSILTIIVLCLVLKSAKRNTCNKSVKSEIPASKTNHQYDNYALEREASAGFYGNTQTNRDTRVSYYGNADGDDHKSEWPNTYNMYEVSRSDAFPKTGDQSSETEMKPRPVRPPSSIASSISHEVQHKSFSEEVFEGIRFETTVKVPSEPASQGSGTGIWKYRMPSEAASLRSHDTGSMQGSTASRDYRVLTEQRSYYSSFKPRKVSMSTEASNTSQITETSRGKNFGSKREKITRQSITTSGTKKVFTFELK